MEEASAYHNKKYFDRWYRLLTNSPFKGYYRYIARTYEPKFEKYGYALTKGFGLGEEALEGRGKVSDAVGAFYCDAADACAFMRRLSARFNARLRIAAKAVLPAFVVTKIRQAREKKRYHSPELRRQKHRTEVRGQRSEVRGQRSEHGGQGTGLR
jgi:hypothetical protein